MLWLVPDRLKTQDMCNRVVDGDSCVLKYVPDRLKTQDMCEEAVRESPWMLEYVPDEFKTQDMCNRAVREYPCMLKYVTDEFKTQDMCEEAIREDSELWEYAGVLFSYHHKRQFGRGIRDELLPIAWHPDRVYDWCFDEEEKKVAGQLWN